MTSHIENRDNITDSLIRELVGPDPKGEPLSIDSRPTFPDQASSFGPWRSPVGQEILQRDRPSKRYGIGVLYPAQTQDADASGVTADVISDQAPFTVSEVDAQKDPNQILTVEARKDLDLLEKAELGGRAEPDGEDLDLASANTYRPSTMAISFSISLAESCVVNVRATGGRYKKLEVDVAGSLRIWWVRSDVSLDATFNSSSLSCVHGKVVPPDGLNGVNLDGMFLSVEAFCRPSPSAGEQLLTVCLVNRHQAGASIDEFCLFQSHFAVEVLLDGRPHPVIRPYPALPMEKMDEEELNLALLYREFETFAIGHGCAANWGQTQADSGVSEVSAECLPTFEAPSIAPDIKRADGSLIEVGMAALAGLIPGNDGLDQIAAVIEDYSDWIARKTEEAKLLPSKFETPASANLLSCLGSLDRMRRGFAYLKGNPEAMEAFRLANLAILLQQTRQNDRREVVYDPAKRTIHHSRPFSEGSPLSPPQGKGKWRPFQIAFFVMSLESTANGTSADREIVELIWFPTGGGKTEAYLGLSAFSMFLRRLRQPSDVGVDVLMRYTLRLLTAQQFQRAAGLICAMEYLRKERHQKLGQTPFSIGIWLGGDTTPNSSKDAATRLSELQRNSHKAENPFLITKCPWCAAQMGPLKLAPNVPRSVPRVLGYEKRGTAVIFRCTDQQCPFFNELPIFVVDEEVYLHSPSLVIGTVDKFAMLAWRPEARSLFGLDAGGKRIQSPPTLIIQDELHLISGPLGTMVGLYEVLIEELCTDYRTGTIRPKLVSSTATIRRYKDQIKALYARESVSLFPPSGLETSDSFFARYSIEADGTPSRGRKYVGINAPGLGSLQTTQVRTFSALLQAPVHLSPAERDPWWTLVAFFNSLRELGTTLSLFQSDIPDYLKAFKSRTGIPYSDLRRLKHVIELTGRLSSEEIPESIAALEATCNSTANSVDVCLASNILEVGIDIDRLSLMAVVGQPKTTSQYIQVTGRVGRKWWERPGLVVTIYGASKPRDRSHFEKFRSYHERLYAQVEPTSVTPFSPPALDRGLHAVMAGYVRQLGTASEGASPNPVPSEALKSLRSILENRVQVVDQSELVEMLHLFDKRVAEWQRWERVRWGDPYSANTTLPLLRVAGSYCSPELERLSWPTPQSMRNVDAECQVEITTLYIEQDDQNA